MNTLTDITLPQLLTPSISSDPHVVSLAEAIDPNLNAIVPASAETLILSRIDTLPEKILDLLAWQFHADFYDLAYNISVKRRHVKSAILWHLHKGTIYAIREALRLIDIQAQFTNWPDFNGQPYTFMISAVVAGPFYRTRGKDKLISSIRRAVSEAKAERSLMVKLDVQIRQKESTYLFGAVAKSQTLDISLGVNESQMHELLLIFEKRILDRMTTNLNTTLNQLDANEHRIKEALENSERAQISRLNEYENRMNSQIEDEARRIWQRIEDNRQEVNARIDVLSAEFRAGMDHLAHLLTWTE